MEQQPTPAPVEQPTPRVMTTAVVAAVAGLLGVLVGAGIVGVVVLDRPGEGAAAGSAAVAPVPAVEGAAGSAVEGSSGSAVEGASGSAVDVVADVAEVLLPSVVRIDVRGVGAGSSGNASGVVWDDAGHIVTNDHVVAAATTVSVTYADGTTVPATVEGTDPSTDLAVLAVQDAAGIPVRLATAAPRVGQVAVAIGSPLGLDGTVTAGVVSAVDRPIDLRTSDGTLVRMTGVLQTDAAIGPGNSGGALADASGRLIGVSSAVVGEQFGGTVGFAVPVAVVADVVQELIAEGAVPRPFLGLRGVTADGDRPGALVEGVTADGPAARAGLLVGDLVTAVDDRAVGSMADLVAAVRGAGVDATIVVAFVRDGAPQTTTVTLTDATGR